MLSSYTWVFQQMGVLLQIYLLFETENVLMCITTCSSFSSKSRCKRQLLLSWCINTCFYLLLRLNRFVSFDLCTFFVFDNPNCTLHFDTFDRDEGSLNVKGHPVMFRLVQLKVLILLSPTFENIILKCPHDNNK